MQVISVQCCLTSDVAPSPRVLDAAAMFGIDVDAARARLVIPPVEIPLPLDCGGVVLITGPSGGGKSTLLRVLAARCAERGRAVIDLPPTRDLLDRSLVDGFDLPLPSAMALLARAGLGEALVMLQRPRELSDGQRARLDLAWAMHEADRAGAGTVIAADEFGATLDRLTAHVVACNVRRWISATRHVFIAATSHDDVLEPLAPDVLVWKGLGDEIEVLTR